MRNAPLKFQPFPAAGIDAASEGKPAPTNLSTSLTLAAMSLGYGVVQLDVTIVNTALDSIGTSLGGGVAELQWVVSAYTIAFAAFILTAGALGDFFQYVIDHPVSLSRQKSAEAVRGSTGSAAVPAAK